MEEVVRGVGREDSSASGQAISQADVTANLASGLHWLHFSAPVEKAFEAESGTRRSRRLFFQEIPALLLFEILVFVDFSALPDVVPLALILRLGVMNVIGAVTMWMLWRNPPPILREGLPTLVLVAQSAILLVLVAASDSPFRGHYHVGMLLVVMFGVMVQRIRFWYMVVGSVATLVLFTVAGVMFSGLHPIELQGTMSIMFVATLFSMMAGYALEHDERLTWLRSQNERLRSERFEEMSAIDPLTGLGNRRALDAMLATLSVSGPPDKTLAVAIADIDLFKAYNDAFGHVAGDDCLRRIAGRLVGEARKHGDHVFRFGGEEFIILLTDADAEAALLTCERMRGAVEAAAVPHVAPHPDAVVTISIGLAMVPYSLARNADSLIFEADAALYEAKSRGRNQVRTIPFKPEALRPGTRGSAVA